MANFKILENHSQFEAELKNAGSKLVVVDFYAEWCPPCKAIGPKFKQLASEYPNAVFLKVNVDEMEETSEKHGINAMPTFKFFKDGVEKDEMKGADDAKLEEKIKQWY